jgi:hypothetical protein
MSSAETMPKGLKIPALRVSKRVSGRKGAFWSGVVEGFSGPLMMGTPVKGCAAPSASADKSGHYISIILGQDRVYASLALSSWRLAKAMSRATDEVMEINNLVYGKIREKTLDAEGKFRTVERATIVPRAIRLSDEPRK